MTLPDPTQIAFDGKRLLIVARFGLGDVDKPDFMRTAGDSDPRRSAVGGLQAAISSRSRLRECGS